MSPRPTPSPTPRGARTHRRQPRSRLRGWARHHRLMCQDSAWRLFRAPVGSLLTMLAIAIALVLPAALWLTLDSAQLLDAELEESATLTVYLAAQVEEAQAVRIDEALAAHEGVANTRLITAAEGMAEFQQALGLTDALGSLDTNPLPASIVVTPREPEPQAMRVLGESLEQVNGVDEVRLDLAWVERLRHLGELGRRVALALGVLFGGGVLLVVGNTIRLAVESRRQEIEVVTLIGATHAFVRRPFLYSGAWYGLGGGLIAWGLLALGGEWLAAPVATLAASYGASFSLPHLGPGGSAILVGCSILLGWLGAWIAVSRHLASIRPR
ncbi:permease-like cell division protein FtsX [Halomonas urumqiensis]|uniref:Cell division protein FtsX n=1 Tax=Halomonas urumqiensis TaxID=1684789 RepID=A0A2N7UIY0_9GAMM|nr:permease-like cell division protein FtsX [Halomonas urumqiensis]PMR80355.1 cell division protein FtsX [Halomonas urumqiensis]PTB01540.1 cell division protein FtsX [Halomonas urumqiensis]GHE22375.1 cell division protein FtsX [Halomonas urumqiensis]